MLWPNLGVRILSSQNSLLSFGQRPRFGHHKASLPFRSPFSLLFEALFPSFFQALAIGEVDGKHRGRSAANIDGEPSSGDPTNQSSTSSSTEAITECLKNYYRMEIVKLPFYMDMEPDIDCGWKPKVGMTFDSEESAYDFYNAYG
ncbi:hypothetical protein ACSBR1_003625 [Camellia fascicularis]